VVLRIYYYICTTTNKNNDMKTSAVVKEIFLADLETKNFKCYFDIDDSKVDVFSNGHLYSVCIDFEYEINATLESDNGTGYNVETIFTAVDIVFFDSTGDEVAINAKGSDLREFRDFLSIRFEDYVNDNKIYDNE